MLSKLHRITTVSLISLALGWLPSLAVADNHLVNIATGGVSGVYYPAGEGICRLINKRRKQLQIHCQAQSTKGSVYNTQAVIEDQFNLAIVQSDVLSNAYHGKPPFKQSVPGNQLRALFSLHSEPFTIVAQASSGIESLDQLAGKRVNIGNPGSGERALMDILIAAKGWSLESFSEVSELRSAKLARQLCEDSFDAMVIAVGHPNELIERAISRCDGVLIQADDPATRELVAKHDYYESADIPGGIYQGHPDPTPSFGVRATLIATEKLDQELAYQLVKTVFESLEDFKQLHPALRQLSKQQMIQASRTVPLHPGAIRYYSEAGLLP